jgi:IS30 family transposase
MRPKVKESREVTRARIQAFSAAGSSERRIASKVGYARSTVQFWKNKRNVKVKTWPRKLVLLSPSTKRSIKSHMYQKTGSSVRKCARRLNFLKRY